MIIFNVGLVYTIGDKDNTYKATGTIYMDDSAEDFLELPPRVQAKALAANELRDRMRGASVIQADILGTSNSSSVVELRI